VDDSFNLSVEVWGDLVLGVADEYSVELIPNFWGQSTVISGPDFSHLATRPGGLDHLQSLLGLAQVKGEAYDVPAFFEHILVLVKGWKLHDLKLGDVLLEKNEGRKDWFRGQRNRNHFDLEFEPM